MLGFRGHFSTKSRRYSTTLGALRQARADYRAAQATRQPSAWPTRTGRPSSSSPTGTSPDTGHTPGESWLAASIADTRNPKPPAKPAWKETGHD